MQTKTDLLNDAILSLVEESQSTWHSQIVHELPFFVPEYTLDSEESTWLGDPSEDWDCTGCTTVHGFNTFAISMTKADGWTTLWMPDNAYGLCAAFGIVFYLVSKERLTGKLSFIVRLLDPKTAPRFFVRLVPLVLEFVYGSQQFWPDSRNMDSVRERMEHFGIPDSVLCDRDGLVLTNCGTDPKLGPVWHVGVRLWDDDYCDE